MVLAGMVEVAQRIPHCVHCRLVLGKFIAEMAINIHQKRHHLEDKKGDGMDRHSESADVDDASLQCGLQRMERVGRKGSGVDGLVVYLVEGAVEEARVHGAMDDVKV